MRRNFPSLISVVAVGAAVLLQPALANPSGASLPKGLDAAAFERLTNRNSPALAKFVDEWRSPAIGKSLDDPSASFYQQHCRSVAYVGHKTAVGTGTVISKDGMILTNASVVKDQQNVKVALIQACDGSENMKVYSGRVKSLNKERDLAVVELIQKPDQLFPVTIALAQDVQVGTTVYSVGRPTAATWEMTQSTVAKVNASIKRDGADSLPVIQTDSAQNQNKPGGPLFLADGRQVGVNIAELVLSGKLPSAGGTFAIAGETVIGLLDELGLKFSGPRIERDSQGKPPIAPIKPAPQTDNNESAKPDQDNRESEQDRSPEPLVDNDSTDKPPCKEKVLYSGRDEKLKGNIRVSDMNCSGKPNNRQLVPDDETRPLVTDADRNGDSLPDMQLVDLDRDGLIDISFYDNDFDKRFETMGRHADGSAEPSSEEAIPPVLPLEKSLRNDPMFKSLGR